MYSKSTKYSLSRKFSFWARQHIKYEDKMLSRMLNLNFPEIRLNLDWSRTILEMFSGNQTVSRDLIDPTHWHVSKIVLPLLFIAL